MGGESENFDEEITRLRNELAEARKSSQLLDSCLKEKNAKLERSIRELEAEFCHRKRVEESVRLYEAHLEALFQLSRMTEASVPQIADFVLREQTKITKSKVGTLTLLDNDEKLSSVYAWPPGLMDICTLPDRAMSISNRSGLWAQSVRDRKPVIVNDYPAPHPFKQGLPNGHIAITRFLGVPAFSAGKIVALTLVGNKEEEYDEQDVRQVSLLLDGMWKLIERMRAEVSLQEKAELIELAADSIVIRDLNDRILFWNAGAETCYGWKKEDAIGQVSHSLLRTRLPKPLEEIREQLFQKGRWEGELAHVTRKGNEIFVATRWALLQGGEEKGRAILEVSTDITGRKVMEKQLQEKSSRLQEVNVALKILLKHKDEDRRELEEAILANIESLIVPYIKRIKATPLSSTQLTLIEVLESHLRELTSEFGKTLAMQYRVLTPAEMRVAALVREGKTSKEIAEILCISEKTASFHRGNIRSKLGLRAAGVNLRSHLLSFT